MTLAASLTMTLTASLTMTLTASLTMTLTASLTMTLTASIDAAAEMLQGVAGELIARLDAQSVLKTRLCAAVQFLGRVSTAQVVVRKMARLVATRFDGALEPRDGLVVAAQLD